MDESNTRSSILRYLIWFVVILLGILVIGFLALGIPSVAGDEAIPEAEWGVGADGIEPSWTGLLRAWPEADTDIDPDLANLGYTLFFDPVLSAGNDQSCAHCHHPDKGFGDGLTVSENAAGEQLNRHAPSLWNVAYNASFFWDGRADSLEAQAKESLLSSSEMSQDAEELVTELGAIDDYVTAFDALFDDGITLDNVTSALAEFERTLVSDGAAFDAYAAGDFDALNPQQRRGLGLFRAAVTRCFECHTAPNFTDQTFRVVGVPDNGSDDRGRGAVTTGADYAFKVPTLRNAVLSAPYMHNGELATLEAVIDLYATGADRFDLAQVDRQVEMGFDLTDQETADLIAFLYALVDETIPEAYWNGLNYIDSEGHILIPESVPSDSDQLISPYENPARVNVELAEAEPANRPECNRDEATSTVTVSDGQTIQQAVDCAEQGDTVLVPPGIYRERVVIDTSGITLRGMANEPDICPVQTAEALFPTGDDAPDWPILEGDIDGDGSADLSDGVIASGNDFTMEYFIVRNYAGNGVLVDGVRGVTLRHTYSENTGLYGLYPVRSTDVLVECNVSTRVIDAAIYVGQSRDIVVRNNLVYDNIAGIEIENSAYAQVYDNEAWNNVGGLLVFLLTNLRSRVSTEIAVYDNFIHDNNRDKGDANTGLVALIPTGTGMLLMGTDHTEVTNNRIENNDSFGIALVALYMAYEPGEIENVGPLPENNHIHDNSFINNGSNPDPAVTDAGLPGADLIWDTEGSGNVWDESGATRFPPLLPGSGWPDIAQRAVYRILNFAAHNL